MDPVVTKKHFHKTMTHLIADRIMIEAKRELYLTDKQIKLIASDLGEMVSSQCFQQTLLPINAPLHPN